MVAWSAVVDCCMSPVMNVHCGQDCEDDQSPGVSGGSVSAPSCNPTKLCMRTINACGVGITQSDCENWYQTPSNCADMSSYLACNCNCYCESSCGDYFDCGQSCFNQFC